MHRFINPVLITLLFLTPAAFSQSLSSRLSLNAGFAQPAGDFAKKDNSANAGFARFGFGAGAEFDLLFGETGLAWASSFFYMANDYQTESYFKWIPDLQLQDTGSYTNYPIMTGLKYVKNLGDNFTLFGFGQLGLNIANGPFFGGYIVGDDDNLYLVEVEMGNDTSKGFTAGLGFIANRTTTVSLRYFSLGSPYFSSTARYKIGEDSHAIDINIDQPVSIFLLTVGYTIDFSD